MSIVEAASISLRLGSTQVLLDVSFGVAPGEIVAVLGRSGSGKSTLLHCLAGILRPDEGEVRLCGDRLDNRTEARRSSERLRRMGFVFQFGDLIPELTMAENVALPLQLNGIRKKAARGQATDALRDLGVDDIADRFLQEVSGGQAQRAAVARALVHQPAVVFADEPTGSLDTVAGEGVMEALCHAARARNAAVVIVTHDLKVASYADRDVTLRDGQVYIPAGLSR